jgi:hypothetical protein
MCILNFAANDDHEATGERFIKAIKDSCRSQYNLLPFKYIPKAINRHLVLNSVIWWNAIPGIAPSDMYSGHYILNGSHIDNNRHVRIPFRADVQTHEPHEYSMAVRTAPAIAFGPRGNQRGSHYFFRYVMDECRGAHAGMNFPCHREL